MYVNVSGFKKSEPYNGKELFFLICYYNTMFEILLKYILIRTYDFFLKDVIYLHVYFLLVNDITAPLNQSIFLTKCFGFMHIYLRFVNNVIYNHTSNPKYYFYYSYSITLYYYYYFFFFIKVKR